MATLYLDRKGLEVKLDGTALALYENGKRLSSVPLALLKRVVFRAETTLTSNVFGALAEAGCSGIILSSRKGRRLAFIQGRPHNDAAVRVAQYAATQDSAWRLEWTQRFIAAKITRQQRLMRHALDARPVRCKCISDALRTLKSLEQRIRKGVQSIDTLRGLEGAAQAAYFRAYTTLFPPSLDFHRRNRRPPRDPVNACLSLAYTLAHFEAVRIAYIVGLDPFLGFFHEIAFGRESLACDLIEPIRPSIDRWVWDLFRSRTLRTEHFRSDKNACVLGKAGRSHFYKHFDPLLRDTASALGGYCRLLVKALRSKSPELPVADGEFEP